ncbi:MAG: methyltransferase domain-containing protein [Phycisphaerales bacterium]|nr:methyltransferase domain-containing protein [Phycisphaerales bacterium]
MVADLPWSKARVVVEYGPGTGVVTEQILLSMPRDCIFFGIERNERMVELSRRRHPGVSIYQDNAAKVSDLCVQQGLAAEGSVDLVLSGLPWPSFTDELRADILNATAQVLRPGGVFVTFGYHIGLVLRGAWHFRRTVSELFSDVSTSKVVWRNVPPAFVYRCTK